MLVGVFIFSPKVDGVACHLYVITQGKGDGMTTYTAPTAEQLNTIIDSFHDYTKISGVAIAIGWSLTGEQSAQDIHLRVNGELYSLEGHQIKPTNHILFKLGSTSKLITATAFAYACQDVDSPIHMESKLGEFIQFKGMMGDRLNNLLLKNLANYTSGLPTDNKDAPEGLHPPFEYNQIYSVHDMVKHLNGADFELDPQGEIYHYSNLGFSLLAVAISRAYGTNGFNVWARDYLFRNEVLEMKDSRYCPLYGEPWPDNYPLGYVYTQDGAEALTAELSYDGQFGAYYGGGGVMSSPHDMMRWLNFNLGKLPEGPHFPSQALLAALQNPSTNVRVNDKGYLCLGWFMSQDKSELRKNGLLSGANTAMVIATSPDAGNIPAPAGVYVLINMSGANDLATSIAEGVLSVMKHST